VSRGLTAVSKSTIERLHAALESGRLRGPITRSKLIAYGVREQLDALVSTLAGYSTQACLSLLGAVLAERERFDRPAPELVWTGPEGARATARDTAVILRDLFEGAQERVVLAGYTFLNSERVLKALHESMQARGVVAYFFVEVSQLERGVADPEAALQAPLQRFVASNWRFGPPFPEVYCDRRAGQPGPPWSSLHAKCVAVDGQRAFISSANFTSRAQERNIEAGVLIDDVTFSGQLERQWLGLIRAGLVVRWAPSEE